MRGLLVVVEGINGAGKSTVIELAAKQLEAVGRTTVVYKFPNRKGLWGSRIDRYLRGELTMSSKYDILHMFASNRSVVRDNIIADIDSGKVVVCDRYIFSAIAYHIPPRVTDMGTIRNYCRVISYFDKDMPVPDIIYLVDGDHLHRRTGSGAEIFHAPEKAQCLKNMIYNVIRNYPTKLVVLHNRAGEAETVATLMARDIETLLF